MGISRRQLFNFIAPLGTLSFLMPGTLRAKIDNGATLSNEKDLTNSKTYLANRVSVSPIDFGAVSNNADIDHTEIILRVIKFAEQNNKAVDLRGGPWRITRALDFTNIKQIIVDWTGRLIVNPNSFKDENGYVVYIGVPGSNVKNGRAIYTSIVGVLLIISENRDATLNGVFIKGNFLTIDSIRAINFNGTGVHISATWDSTIQSISAERCGNVKNFQLRIEPGGDTSNCLFIGRIQSERAYHKCLEIKCIRSVINTIHAERTLIQTDDDGTKPLISGLKYVNVSIQIGNSTINQMIYDNVSDKVATSQVFSSVVINLDQSSMRDGQFNTSHVVSNFGRNSAFENFAVYQFFSGKGVRDSSFSNFKVKKSFLAKSNIRIIGGNIKNLSLAKDAENILLNGCNISSVLLGEKMNNIFFANCTFTKSAEISDSPTAKYDHLNLSVPVIFSDCIFKGSVSGVDKTPLSIRGGNIKKVNLKSNSRVYFENVSIGSFSYTGRPLFTTKNCYIEKMVSWSQPSNDVYQRGMTTEISTDEGITQYIYKSPQVGWVKIE
ncbi:hypothetical protein [Klebsiella michiganensis]|jgi:hypothetical protein|uniref:hypothetical protein n=1 Tax=Klebsiella michiganensis TaxID=1134687 RepID=UPI0007CC4EE0|nr:hypothetical protein [Klebsiella michiganensis]MDI3167541.1 hypothetical protein [Klebsiella michiganensis]MDK3048617.1 hypothetical protein [Klebsiella michiganensis]MDU2423637.1 hypothetical protein [Klebsiella michiganensis]UIU18019.1 hypothetical protein LLZ89_28400 [Klebsiella michiganensis]SBM07307.1 Uncharacterised protein [Klebsiella michiganensis]